MNIVTHLRRVTQERPNSAALIGGHAVGERSLTFSQLDAISGEVGLLLERSGLKPGDRLLLLLHPGVDLFVILLAALRRGIACVLPDVGGGIAGLKALCARTNPKGVAADSRAWPLFLTCGKIWSIPIRFSPGGALFGSIPVDTFACAQVTDPVTVKVNANHPALITCTSGTTGTPKIAVRTHGFLEAQRRAISACLELQPGEMDLVTLPVFTLANLSAGITSLIADADFSNPGRTDPARIFRQMDRHRPSRMACSPAFIERLLDAIEHSRKEADGTFHEQARFTPRKIFLGGAPVFPALLRRIKRLFPDASPACVYGSTEAEPIARLSLGDIKPGDVQPATRGRGLLVGTPVAGIEVRILPDRWGHSLGILTPAELDKLTLPKGLAGEIVVSGPHVLGGYLDGVGDMENKFRVGDTWWHRTGDAGRIDEQGRIWLLGRCPTRIETEPRPLYNLEIEAAAMDFDWIRQAGLVLAGEQRCLAISTRRMPTSAEFRAFRLALSWAKLGSICTFPALPTDRRHQSKINHAALEKMVRRALGMPKKD